MGVKVTKAHAVPALVVATANTNRGAAPGEMFADGEILATLSACSALSITSSSFPVLKLVSDVFLPALCSNQALETCSRCCTTHMGGTPSYQCRTTPSRSARRELVRTLARAEPRRVKVWGWRIASSPILKACKLRAR